MNQIIVIGNLTAKPAIATRNIAGTDISVCHFTVAVNEGYGDRRKTQYFRVTAWRKLAENCANYLDKGSKVCVTGKVSASIATGQNNVVYANLEIDTTQGGVEFLSPHTTAAQPTEAEIATATIMQAETELPWGE